jgi:hypothetical protein
MANSIALAAKFQPILDELYKLASVTAVMDSQTKPVNFGGANVVNVFKISMVGLGTYSRNTGYPVGDVTGTWEPLTLAQSRGREFSIDRMDDEESLGMAFGQLAGEFIRTQVAPEIDAYRFAKYAQTANILSATPATLSASTVLAAIDAAGLAMDDAEVPAEGRILYVSSSVSAFLKAALTRMLANENAADRRVKNLDNMNIISVPQSRFATKVTLDAGATSSAGGFAKDGSTGKDLNFMMIHPSAVVQATKLAALKIFTPEENQDMDAYKVQYRLYHDAFALDNHVKGIYIHNKA